MCKGPKLIGENILVCVYWDNVFTFLGQCRIWELECITMQEKSYFNKINEISD